VAARLFFPKEINNVKQNLLNPLKLNSHWLNPYKPNTKSMKTSNNLVDPLLKSGKPVRTSRSVALATLALALLGSALPASAANMVLTTTEPTPGPNDVYNFAGADNDAANVNGGADQQTYVAFDRPTQGQNFTTPAGAGGYLISDVWIRHAGYTNIAAGNGTFWQLGSGAAYTIRVTDPSQVGLAGFAISSESYTATGTENAGALWTGGGTVGDDMWLHFTLTTPIHLSGSTKYGIDLTASVNGNANYFEWLGTANSGALTDGEAYTGSAAHIPGNTVTTNAGDRVFLVQLTQTVPRVAPDLASASRFASVGQPVQVTVTIPQIVNANNTVTLNLASDNAGIAAFSLGGLATTNLTFNSGATNVQTFTAYVRGTGSANLVVVTNAAFLDASIQIGSSIAANESFQYDPTVQTTLDGANGGGGFSAPWADAAGGGTIIAGLTYGTNPSLVTSSNAVTVSADNAFRTLASTYGGVGGGTVWISFEAQSSGLNTYGGISFFTGTGSEHLFMGEVPGNSPNNTWGFLLGGATYMNFANSVTPGSQTDFLVYRIDFPSTNGGQVLVSFYADPVLNTNAPLSPTGSGLVNSFTFDTIRLGTSGTVTWDEIRIGTDWTNVVPFLGTGGPPALPIPTMSVPALFLPVGQDTAVTVSIPANSSRPLSMTITNSNPTAFSVSSTNATSTSLTFGVGATNVQTFNVHCLAAGAATLTVVSNSTVNTASISFASQVSASESFEYDALVDGLPGNLGGTGFDVNAWAGGGSVVSPGLTYPRLVTFSNYASIVGVAAAGSGNGTRALFLSSGNYGGVGGGTVWISFLIQGAFPGTPQTAGVTLGTTFFMGLDTTTANNGKWGFTGPGAGPTGFPNSVTPSTNTDLLVYRLDFPSVPGDLITVTMYANPVVGPNPPPTPTGSAAANLFTFNQIQLGTDFNMNFDEIRVGGSWAEVVPLLPTLSIVQISSSQVRISWPVGAAGSLLQSSANVTGPWADAGLSISTQNGQYIATDSLAGSRKFYRLLIQ
jgi:hypothetical protein